MPRAPINGIEIEYELSGPEDGQPLLCVHGIGSQLIHWPQPMVDALGAAGFRVIRFDNRDVGLSTHFHGVPVPRTQTSLRRTSKRPHTRRKSTSPA